jgi:glucose-6-phosphate 1-dehydrogenase
MPTPPLTVVLIGATGDLSKRKLLPGLLHLFQTGLLRDLQVSAPPSTSTDGTPSSTSRRRPSTSTRRSRSRRRTGRTSRSGCGGHRGRQGPDGLKAVVDEADEAAGSDKPRDRLHYLSVPPKAALEVVQILKEADLVARSRIIMEKPFGTTWRRPRT